MVTQNNSVLCLVINNLVIHQWREQIYKWTNISNNSLVDISSSGKKSFTYNLKHNAIYISTYKIISYKQRREGIGILFYNKIFFSSWGLLVCDECHIIRSPVLVQKIIQINHKNALGLTAIIEQNKDISSLEKKIIGPEIAKIKWKKLSLFGSISKIKYIELTIPFSKKEKYQYDLANNNLMKFTLATKNSNKILICKFLVNHFSNIKNYNILIYCDSLTLHREVENHLRIPSISGTTNKVDREKIIENFRKFQGSNVILFSRVGDTSIDIPNANLIIQLSSDRSSYIQEIQRLGRIIRPNDISQSIKYSLFINLITQDSIETLYSKKRKFYITEQDYHCDTYIVEIKKHKIKKLRFEFNKS
mmetsp:Transcript_26474/g.36896  ORF Transcript_26474/g.36896 Transcript_26474/m.36896 type:complete len:362 (-) Transcript_26474:1792-2877(-)